VVRARDTRKLAYKRKLTGAVVGARVDGGISNSVDRIREMLAAILREDLTIMLPYGFVGASVNPEVLGP
jgi:hypothetical protein